jgi:hypothetical protein
VLQKSTALSSRYEFVAHLNRLESFAGVSRVKFSVFIFFTVALDFQRNFEILSVVNYGAKEFGRYF